MKKLIFLIVFFSIFLPKPVFAISYPQNGLVFQWGANQGQLPSVFTVDGLPSGSSPVSVFAKVKTSQNLLVNSYAFVLFYGAKSAGQGIYFGMGNDANVSANNFFVSNHGDVLGTGVRINDGVWHNLMATFNGSVWEMYLDSVSKGQKTMTTNISQTNILQLGAIGGASPWVGEISNVAVWNRALSAAEVLALNPVNEITMSGVNDIFKIKVGESLVITPNCSSGTAGESFSYDPQIKTITPTFTDGGTIQNIVFKCSSNRDGRVAQKSSKVVIFHDFTKLIKPVNNPIVPVKSQIYNQWGADTVYLRSGSYVNGEYYAFSNVSDTSEGRWNKMPLYKSTDLINWSPVSAIPEIGPSDSGWDQNYLLHPSVIKIGNLWYVYYSAYGTKTWSGNPPPPGSESLGPERIGYATSPDFVNWTKGGAVLGRAGFHAALPSVIKVGSGYRMYYYDRFNNKLKYAESADGIAWQEKSELLPKYAGDWDFNYFLTGFDPSVTVNPGGFYELTYSVLYQTPDFPAGWTQDLGYAVSEDGLTWYKYPGNIMTGSRISGAFDQWYLGNPILYYSGRRIYLYYVGVKTDPVVINGLGAGGVAYLENPQRGVDITDLRLVLANFTQIFNLNTILTGFGK